MRKDEYDSDFVVVSNICADCNLMEERHLHSLRHWTVALDVKTEGMRPSPHIPPFSRIPEAITRASMGSSQSSDV